MNPLAPATRRRLAAGTPSLAGLVALASLGGILSPSAYARESADWRGQALGQDWFDLVVTVPWLVACALGTLRGGVTGTCSSAERSSSLSTPSSCTPSRSDLAIVLPAHVIAGVALLQRRPAGALLAPLVLAFVPMAASIGGMMIVMHVLGLPATLPVAAAMLGLAAITGTALAHLLARLQPRG